MWVMGCNVLWNVVCIEVLLLLILDLCLCSNVGKKLVCSSFLI